MPGYDFLLGVKNNLMSQMTWICHIKEEKKLFMVKANKVFDHEDIFFSTVLYTFIVAL
jgi:hypothetical protein